MLEDEESPPEFEENEEIENVMYEENAIPIVGESSRQTDSGENENEMNIFEPPTLGTIGDHGDTSDDSLVDVGLRPIDGPNNIDEFYDF